MASSSIAARSTFVGKAVQAKTQQPKASRAQAVVCKAQSQETTLATRRAAMSAFAVRTLIELVHPLSTPVNIVNVNARMMCMPVSI